MNTSQPVPTLVASALKVFAASLKSDAALYQANQSLIQDVVRAMLQQIEVILEKGDREDVKEVEKSPRVMSMNASMPAACRSSHIWSILSWMLVSCLRRGHV